MKSIRSFLIYSLVLSIGLVVLIAIIVGYERITHETEELYDAELAQISRVLEAVLAIELDFAEHAEPTASLSSQTLILPPAIDTDDEYDSSGHKYEKKLAFQVWSRKGVPILGSDASGAVLPFSAQAGYKNETLNNQDWRTFSLYSEQLSIWIKVGQLIEIRDEVTEEIATIFGIVPLVMFPIIILLITLNVRYGLSPLRHICREISARGTENLTPLNIKKVPSELNQVVDSVNHLLTSLDKALERQKRFTANAAHELRTPLAAIRVHVQNIYPEDDRLRRVQGHIIQGIDKLTHLFNQLITLSRAETSDYASHQQKVELTALVEGLKAQDCKRAIVDKGIEVTLDINAPVVTANPDALTIILRNLLDNALKYTPDGGLVTVRSYSDHGKVTVEVEDNGPGLSEQQQQLAFERFYRAADQTIEGCGLGLSIVYQLCNQFNYDIKLSSSTQFETGLKVSIEKV